jgi:hypothetical protein
MTVIRRTPIVAVATLFAAFVPITAMAQDQPVGFQAPSHNIYCLLEPPYDGHPDTDLRCDIQQMTSKPPKPPKDCPLSYGDAFSIGPNSDKGVMICHGDTTKEDGLMVLAYGTQWNQSGFLCKSAITGLTCTNAKGHGFMLSRAAQKIF